jgi:DNA recombination-mediator protein A/magnesium chelatase subunit ChlI-like protein
VTVSRAMTSVRFPASFALVAAANPCPCGHLGDSRFACRCSLYDLHRYASRLSGPLLDRIDLYVQAERLTAHELAGAADAEPTAIVRARVLAARALQRSRQGTENGRLPSAGLATHCQITAGAPANAHGRRRPPRPQRPRIPPRPTGRPHGRRPRGRRPGRRRPHQGGPRPPPPPDHRRPGGPAGMTSRHARPDWLAPGVGERDVLLALAATAGPLPAAVATRLAEGRDPVGLLRAHSPEPGDVAGQLDGLGVRFLVSSDPAWPLAATPPDPPAPGCSWPGRARPSRPGRWRWWAAAVPLRCGAPPHAGAVDAGGRTVVVLGCGLDVAYPRANTDLFAKVRAAGGTLVSEHPPGARPLAANFLPRNRLIAALAAAVVVVEAAEDSGSLPTARAAGSRGGGRVLVVPGAPGTRARPAATSSSATAPPWSAASPTSWKSSAAPSPPSGPRPHLGGPRWDGQPEQCWPHWSTARSWVPTASPRPPACAPPTWTPPCSTSNWPDSSAAPPPASRPSPSPSPRHPPHHRTHRPGTSQFAVPQPAPAAISRASGPVTRRLGHPTAGWRVGRGA